MAQSKKHQHDLLSKSEIAKALGMTSQTFSNRQARDDKFPAPTYSNRSGSVALYAPEDAKKVYDYCTRAERERLAKAEKMFASLTSGELSFEDVELPMEEDVEAEAEEAEEEAAPAPAKVTAPAKEEAPKQSAADKAAADKKAADEKAAKAKATADKIKAADAKIAADKVEADRKAAEKARLDKNEAAKLARQDNNTGIAAKTEAPKSAPVKAQTPAPAASSKGTGAAFGLPAK